MLRLKSQWFNPLYFHLRKYVSDPKITQIKVFGGKSSAKTFSIAQLLDVLGVTENASSICYRKEQATIKTTLKPAFVKAMNSCYLGNAYDVMDFQFRGAANDIVFKGLDTEGKVKGIEGFKYLLFDELDQFTQEEWLQANLSLRGIPNQKLFATWNPISEFSWVKKEIDATEWIELPKEIEGNPYSKLHHTSYVRISKDGRTLLIKTTYHDNKWIVGGDGYGYRDQNLIDLYEGLIATNPNSYRVNVLGEWGKAEVQRPYCHNFSVSKHVSTGTIYQPTRPIIFSLDFNVEPFACTCSHQWRDSTEHKHFFKELVIENNGDVHEMCELMERNFGKVALANALFTGDAMQRKREITQRDNIDAWRIIDRKFNLGKRLKVPRANPSVKENRFLMNTLFSYHPDFKFNPEMKRTIFELQFTEVDEDGDLVKKTRGDEKQRSDFLDATRYDCNVFLHDYLDRYKLK